MMPAAVLPASTKVSVSSNFIHCGPKQRVLKMNCTICAVLPTPARASCRSSLPPGSNWRIRSSRLKMRTSVSRRTCRYLRVLPQQKDRRAVSALTVCVSMPMAALPINIAIACCLPCRVAVRSVSSRVICKGSSQYNVNFRNFHRLDGSFMIPAGARIKSVEVRLLQDGALKASKSVAL